MPLEAPSTLGRTAPDGIDPTLTPLPTPPDPPPIPTAQQADDWRAAFGRLSRLRTFQAVALVALATLLLLSTAWFTQQVDDARAARDRAETVRTGIIELRDLLRIEHVGYWRRRATNGPVRTSDLTFKIAVARSRVQALGVQSDAPEVPDLARRAVVLLDGLNRGIDELVRLDETKPGSKEFDEQNRQNEVDIAELAEVANEWVGAETEQAKRAARRQEDITGRASLYMLLGTGGILLVALGAWLGMDRASRAALRSVHTATEDFEGKSRTDSLTGLANRRAFDEALVVETARSSRSGRPLSLVVFDIDNFKTINDLYGHRRGDEVLREVGTRLESVSRAHELLARVGGEEFAWILPDTDAAAAVAAAERGRTAVADGGVDGIAITVSAGAAAFAGGGDDILQRADEALYEAKRAGRDRVAMAPPPQRAGLA